MASDKMLGSFDQKTTPEDNDLLVEYDASASKVKNVKFGGVWNWIVKKLTSAVISELTTSNQSVVGAINELNSKKANFLRFGTNSEIKVPMPQYNAAIALGTVNSHVTGFYLISRETTKVIITPLTSASKEDDIVATAIDNNYILIKTTKSTDVKIFY